MIDTNDPPTDHRSRYLRQGDLTAEPGAVDDAEHTFQMAAGRAPEADGAIRRLAHWVRPKLGLAGRAHAGTTA
jgi:hypothetical protein